MSMKITVHFISTVFILFQTQLWTCACNVEYDPHGSPKDNKKTAAVLLPVARYNISKLAKLKGDAKLPLHT